MQKKPNINSLKKKIIKQLLRNDLFLLIFLAILSLSLRVVFFNGLNWDDDPDYVQRAFQVAFQHKYIFPDNNGLRIGTYYPAALFYLIFGINQATIVLFPLVLSFFSTIVLFRFGTRFFNQSTGIFAAILNSVYPLDVELSSRLLPDAILPGISLCAVYLLFIADKDNAEIISPKLRNKSHYFFSGLLVAYLPSVNMSAFPILLFFVLYLTIQSSSFIFRITNGYAWGKIFSRLGLFGLGFLLFATSENSLYLHHLGDFFYKYKATIIHYNIDQNFHPDLCTYPDIMFQMHACKPFHFRGWASSYYGFHYLYLLILIIPGLFRCNRWYIWVFVWFWVVFGYLQFGSMSFTEYHPLHRLPRHLNMVTPPMILLLAAGFYALRLNRICKFLSLILLIILIIASMIVVVNRHRDLMDDVLPQKAVHSFIQAIKPDLLYASNNTIAYQRFLDKFNNKTQYLPLSTVVYEPDDGFVVLGEFRNSDEIERSNKIYRIPNNWQLAYTWEVIVHYQSSPKKVLFYRVHARDKKSLKNKKRDEIFDYVKNNLNVLLDNYESLIFWWECSKVDGIDDIIVSNDGKVTLNHLAFEEPKDITYAYLSDFPINHFHSLRLVVDEGRGQVRITDKPSMQNNYTLKINIDDGKIPGADFYRIFIFGSGKLSQMNS
ncbi:glycosyltransferase family 39 protein [bacterium]|nr:glycosyltransferase family 39 protein [bacterium]